MQQPPDTDHLESSIQETKDKIKQLNASTTIGEKNEMAKSNRSAKVSSKYQKLAQLRLDQCNSLKTQWETYVKQQQLHRKMNIDRRQVEFDMDLQLTEAERRRNWRFVEEAPTDEQKKEYSHALIHALGNYQHEFNKDQVQDSTNDENSNHTPMKVDLVTLPMNLIEYLWILNVPVPITNNEISNTIQLIKSRILQI